jgi:hypothetical protein
VHNNFYQLRKVKTTFNLEQEGMYSIAEIVYLNTKFSGQNKHILYSYQQASSQLKLVMKMDHPRFGRNICLKLFSLFIHSYLHPDQIAPIEVNTCAYIAMSTG